MKGHTAPGQGPRPACRGRYAGFCCWGYGEFGQNCHGGCGGKGNVRLEEGDVKQFDSHGERIKLMSCGASHTVVVTDDNVVYSWGNGNSGQLGCGETGTKWDPSEVHLTDDTNRCVVQGVTAGGRHTFLWLGNGQMYSWGNNFYAQLGYDFRIPNYKENQARPHLLRTLTYRPVVEVSCGQKHTLLLFKEGSVAVVGNNSHGQVGDGTTTETVVPKVLDYLPRIKHIIAGSNHNIAVTETGKVYVWGHGKGCGRRRGDVLEPILLPLRAPVKQISAGQFHSLALTDAGLVYSWGHGAGGQLGHGDKISYLETPRRIRSKNLPRPVIQVACGETYSAAITASGGLYMWGKNSHVIVADFASNHVIPYPQRVNPVNKPVSRIACGAWHAAAILGLPVSSEEPVGSMTTAERDADDGQTGASSGMLADRCTHTSRLSRVQSGVSVTTEVSDASSLSEDDSLDDPQEMLQDLLRPSPYPASGPEGPISSHTLAEFYAASQCPPPRMTGTGLGSLNEIMENMPLSSKKPVGGFLAEDGDWRPAYPTFSNGDGESKDCLFNAQTLSSSRSSLNTIDPSSNFNSQGYKDTEPTGEIYTSTGLNQGVIQLSKSRSAEFVLPREKSGYHSQKLDGAALPRAESNPSPRHRFHIDQHVAVHLASRTGSSTSSSKGSSSGSSTTHSSSTGSHEHLSNSRQGRIQAPHVAFRRSKIVHGMHKTPGNNPKKAPSGERLRESPAQKDAGQEFALMVPRTVTFVASEGDNEGNDHITARISISNKLFGNRKGGGVELGIMSEKTFMESKNQQSATINSRRKSGGRSREPSSVSHVKHVPHTRNLGPTGWNSSSPKQTSQLSESSLQNWSEVSVTVVPQVHSGASTALQARQKETLSHYMKPTRTLRKEKPSRR